MKQQEIKSIAWYEAAGLIETALADEQGISNLRENYKLTDREVRLLEEELKKLIVNLRKA